MARGRSFGKFFVAQRIFSDSFEECEIGDKSECSSRSSMCTPMLLHTDDEDWEDIPRMDEI